MGEFVFILWPIVIPVELFVGVLIVGGNIERNHQASLRAREADLAAYPTINWGRWPTGDADRVALVSAHVVIGVNYVKRIIGGVMMVFGGRVLGHERTIDRARREAIVRVRQAARDAGVADLINLRIETSMITPHAVEVFAYATCIWRR